MALQEGGIRPRTPSCERIGLFAAQQAISPDSLEAFDRSIRERGLTRLSAPAFTRMVVNYASGATCRLLGLKGPVATFGMSDGGGLTAVVLCADYLARRRDVDSFLAAAVDQGVRPPSPAPGAGAVLLKAERRPSGICLTGWAVAEQAERAAERALQMAGRKRADVVEWDRSCACAGIGALIGAATALSGEAAGSCLVINGPAAVVLERLEEGNGA